MTSSSFFLAASISAWMSAVEGSATKDLRVAAADAEGPEAPAGASLDVSIALGWKKKENEKVHMN